MVMIILPKGPLETNLQGWIPKADSDFPVEEVVTKLTALKNVKFSFTNANMEDFLNFKLLY